MKRILVALSLLMLASPVFAGVEQLGDISATIANSAFKVQKLNSNNWTYYTIYGTFAADAAGAKGLRVGLYQSVDNTNWFPMSTAAPGDTVMYFNVALGANKICFRQTQTVLTTGDPRGTIQSDRICIPRMKLVFYNATADTFKTCKFWIAYN